MSQPKVLALDGPTATANAERLSLFQSIADKVSYAMGTPLNIGIWIVLVVGWTIAGPYVAHHNFLPAWFISTGYNFPLNLITTVAELYIGFLVGASSNRSERNLEATLGRMSHQEEQIKAQEAQIRSVEKKLSASLDLNTQLTQAVHELTKAIHASVCPAESAFPSK